MVTDNLFQPTGDTARWRTRFDTLRAQHPHGSTLRDPQPDLTGWGLYHSPTWETLFAISPEHEIAHLISLEHIGRAAILAATHHGGLWLLVEDRSWQQKVFESCGYQVIATADGLPGDPRPWMRYRVALMANLPPTGHNTPPRSTQTEFDAAKQQVIAWAKRVTP